MPLKAILLRAEGVLVETDELQRRALKALLAELGYTWPCEREDFAALRHLPSRDSRLEHFVRDNVDHPGAAADLPPLISAMQRRLSGLVQELVSAKMIGSRLGAKDVIAAARDDGLKIVVVSTMRANEIESLLKSALGDATRSTIDSVVYGSGSEEALPELYAEALRKLDIEGAQCLAVEASEKGVSAARAAGVSAIVTRSVFSAGETFDEAVFVADSIPTILPTRIKSDTGPLTAAERTELIAALHRLHAGMVDLAGVLDRSNLMKVSEILKTKGVAVKSIGASETIWATAHRLKADAIGALVVLKADGAIEGIISERDLARGLAEHGSQLPGKLVSELMTKTVITCSPEDSVAGVSKVMIQRRIRHLPVVSQGKIVGLISIGDVLNHRLDQMQQEVNVLRDYAIAKS